MVLAIIIIMGVCLIGLGAFMAISTIKGLNEDLKELNK